MSRLERGLTPSISVEDLCLACAAVGLEFSGRAFPAGDPVRDAGHLQLLQRLRAVLPEATPWRLESEIAPSDGRAIDAIATMAGRQVGFEAETRLEDIQALLRRLGAKRRDARLDRLILVIADTRHNRRVREEHEAVLRLAFAHRPRVVLATLREGAPPPGDGFVLL